MALLSIITQAGFSGRRCLCKPHALCPSESNNKWKCITPESPQHYHLQPLLGYWHWRDKLSNSMSVWQISFENCMSLFNNTVLYMLDIFEPEVKKNIVGTSLKGGIINVIYLVRSIEWLTYPMTLWTVCLEITSANGVSLSQVQGLAEINFFPFLPLR